MKTYRIEVALIDKSNIIEDITIKEDEAEEGDYNSNKNIHSVIEEIIMCGFKIKLGNSKYCCIPPYQIKYVNFEDCPLGELRE
jgi:hypothetical protein